MNIKCIIVSILGLTQGGLAEESTDVRGLQAVEGISAECDMFVASVLRPSETDAMMYEEQDVINSLCNAVSRDTMLHGFVQVKASGNPCLGELMMGLNDVDFIGAITDPDQCEDAIRAGSDARRRMSIMSGEGTVDRNLSWWSRAKAAALAFVKRVAIDAVNTLKNLAIDGINSL
mmetsp:Transcript_6756/g.7831  ORF Transcript_6756/g.7831 Transcript_6756/m.7831 type:complete len:175 (-) Transcript_6756:343-867(-)